MELNVLQFPSCASKVKLIFSKTKLNYLDKCPGKFVKTEYIYVTYFKG